METNASRRRFRFGVFEADELTVELRKQGRRLSLQGQPLQVLLMLLNRPGELVTRAEIQQGLWPNGTFVDFEHGLNTAINKIRDALGDSAASPRFVETLARRGYRFIAPVEVTSGAAVPTAQAEPLPETVASPERPQASAPAQAMDGSPERGLPTLLLSSPDELPQASRQLVRTLFLLLQLMYLGFYVFSLAELALVQDIIRDMALHSAWAVGLVVIAAALGIPTRLYLIAAVAFDAPGLREKFLRIFPALFPLDELWALAPFLLVQQIGYGSALGLTAALVYVPFAQRSLILMGAGAPMRVKSGPAPL